ncbi:hypothetical protein ACH5RR_021113 [Cinchona calisaya]|uniref:Reverse transcriptase Ty1/copia-type domain-containing protein n=1 Tax=Cinchona calisaya TaxID=153742 RepID=A0ABD2ZHE0_9GENT
MKKSNCDHSVFYQQSKAGLILLVVYVDDIVITGSYSASTTALKSFLQTHFQTKDLGMLKYFLGIEVTRCKKGIFLSQRKYVLDLLTATGKLGTKPCSAPMITNMQLTADDGELFSDPAMYRRLVGKLNYLTVTRPDIAYPVSIVSQFMSSPRTTHWAALEQILCYLKGVPGVVYYTVIMVILVLSVSQTQIGQVLKLIGDPPQGIVFLLEVIWYHGKARNKI